MSPRIDAAAAAKVLSGLNRALVVTHEKPDGDAFGSALALRDILVANGREATALLPDPLPVKFLKLAGTDYLTELDPAGLDRFDCVIVVDAAKDDRIALGGKIAWARIGKPVLNIDHHIDNAVSAVWSCVDATAAASAELIWTLAAAIPGWRIPPAAAQLLMLGIVTDTGSFRFTNTTGNTFRAAAALLECGANLEAVTNAAFFSKPLKQQRFEADMLQSCVRSACGGRYLYAVIPDELFQKYDFNMRDGEAIIDLLREIDGVVIAALIYRQLPDRCKISLRSKDSSYPVGPIARTFGGGGHEMAAGITLAGVGLEAAAEQLLRHITSTLEEHAL
jgi:phosphoesterase RecJ-like protein